jgi:hypothetical protein
MKGLKAWTVCLALVAGPATVAAQETLEIPPEIMEAIQSDVATIHMDLMQATIVLEEGQPGSSGPSMTSTWLS